jgi:hypothetical protein
VFARGSPLKFSFGILFVLMILFSFDLLLAALGAGQLLVALIGSALAVAAMIAIFAPLKRHDGHVSPSTVHGRHNANRISLLDVIHATAGDVSLMGTRRHHPPNATETIVIHDRFGADVRMDGGAFHTFGSEKCSTNSAARLGAALAVISGTRAGPFRAAA